MRAAAPKSALRSFVAALAACAALGAAGIVPAPASAMSAEALPLPIARVPDAGRGANDAPSMAWTTEVLVPRCLALRIAEVENICRDESHAFCGDVRAAAFEGLRAEGAVYPGLENRIDASLPFYRGIYEKAAADTLSNAASGIFSADLRTCRDITLNLPVTP